MKELNKIEKKLYIITAILFTIGGAVVGLYVADFLGSYFEGISPVQSTISQVIVAVVFALIMLSLSKPLSKLFYRMTEKAQEIIESRPSYKNMSFVFGLILSVMLALGESILLSIFFSSLDGTVHFIVVLISFAVFAYASVWMFERILGSVGGAREGCVGYVIASSALACDSVLTLVPKLVGKIAVLDTTTAQLAMELTNIEENGEPKEKTERAFNNYIELKKRVNLQMAQGDANKSEIENLVNLAKTKRLCIIAYNPLELFDDQEVSVLYLKSLKN